MSEALSCAADLACHTCGKFGAYAFAGENLCLDCYQERGSCCAERPDDSLSSSCRGVACGVLAHEVAASSDPTEKRSVHADRLRLNPNCCYEACPQCTSVRRLREFQARFPNDWETRLTGSERLQRAARQH